MVSKRFPLLLVVGASLLAVVTPAAAQPATEPAYRLDIEETDWKGTGAQQFYETPLAKYVSDATTKSPINPDYTDRGECLAHRNDAVKPTGWIKNHYAYCHISEDRDISLIELPANKTVSKVYYRLITVGRGAVANDPTAGRRIEFDVFVDEVKVEVQVPGAPSALAVKLAFEMECGGWPTANSCRDQTGRTQERTVAEWNGGQMSFVLTSPVGSGNPAQPDDKAIGVHRLAVHHMPFPPFWPGPVKRYVMEGGFRFDSAQYIYHKGTQYGHGAIFDRVLPRLQLFRSEPGFPQVSEHIWQALNNPGSTKPEVRGKQIPSELHRIYYDGVRRGANNGQAKITCNVYFPGHGSGTGENCDEFPFQTTAEGAAASQYGAPFGQYSAKPVPDTENSIAGNGISVFYGWDRILDGDVFKVIFK